MVTNGIIIKKLYYSASLKSTDIKLCKKFSMIHDFIDLYYIYFDIYSIILFDEIEYHIDSSISYKSFNSN